MAEFWTPLKTEYLTSAGVMTALASLGFYAAKWELACLGISTDQHGWWHLQWMPMQIWRAIKSVQGGPPARLLFWGIMYWIYAISTLILFPFVLYVTYLSFAALARFVQKCAKPDGERDRHVSTPTFRP